MKDSNAILTVFSSADTEISLTALQESLARLNLTVHDINAIPLSNQQPYAVSQLLVRAPHDKLAEIRAALARLSEQSGIDACIQSLEHHRRDYRLACFDMDSTLIKVEVIDELARKAGVGEAVSEITASAMRGELDFRQSFTERMALLKGLPQSVLEEVANGLPLMEGVELLMARLQDRGIKTAILSGGFTYFAEFLQSHLGFDFIHANQLELADEKLTGRVVEPVVDGVRKAKMLAKIAAQLNIDAANTIAVGDGANDLPMLSLAGMGVAFHAKPLVRRSANYALNIPGLEGLLHLIAAD